MRASVMLHLPGLALCGQANAVVRAAVKLGMTVRGIYGEGSRAVGHLFQLSNQSTLGESEGQILDRLEGVVRQIAWHEQSARLRLLRDEPERIYDYVGKAYGILRYSHMITAEDALDRLAALRLGVDLKLIQGRMDRETIGRLMVTVQPGHLQQTTGTPLSETERDARRAEILRAAMGACENRGR
jgi:protein arginine kinase